MKRFLLTLTTVAFLLYFIQPALGGFAQGETFLFTKKKNN